MAAPARSFEAAPSVRGEEPLLIGLVGPPGGGKTVSALRLALGMQRVRKGPIVLIDTEGGRSKKYSPAAGRTADPAALVFDFKRVDFGPPFQSQFFLQAIQEQLRLSPAAIIVDNLSDEHEGEGGYLEWHDEMVDKMGGNEWAAWAKPKAARKRLTSGLLQIKVPVIVTFRAREKTSQTKEGGKTKVVNIGWMPVAPLEIVHTLDLVCLLPPRANGVPVWTSERVGEDFIVKLPNFLAPLIQAGALNEDTGEALARWAAGEQTPSEAGKDDSRVLLLAISNLLKPAPDQAAKKALLAVGFPDLTWKQVERLHPDALSRGKAAIEAHLKSLATITGDQVFELLAQLRARGVELSDFEERYQCRIDQLPADQLGEVQAWLEHGHDAPVPGSQAEGQLTL